MCVQGVTPGVTHSVRCVCVQGVTPGVTHSVRCVCVCSGCDSRCDSQCQVCVCVQGVTPGVTHSVRCSVLGGVTCSASPASISAKTTNVTMLCQSLLVDL